MYDYCMNEFPSPKGSLAYQVRRIGRFRCAAKALIGAGLIAGTISAAAGPACAAERARLQIQPASLTFGNLHAGSTSPAQFVTLSNPGADEIQIASIDVTGQFMTTNDCGATIAPGDSCRIWVQFAPLAIRKTHGQSESGKLAITYGPLGKPKARTNKVHLHGRAFGTASTYIANFGGASLSAYPFGASGDVGPTSTISGAETGLSNPFGIALDSTGNIYVANLSGGASNLGSVTVYAAGASGDAAPIENISGPDTGLNYPWGIAVDSSGSLYVANIGPCCDPSCGESITIYSAGSNGNAAPIATIPADSTTKLNSPYGITFDAAGRLWVADYGGGPSGIGAITVYPPGANGEAAPIINITGDTAGDSNAGLDGPDAVALDAAGNIYATNGLGASLTIYPAGSNGNVSPSARLHGVNTGLTVAEMNIAVDYARNIYVLNSTFGYDLDPPFDIAALISQAPPVWNGSPSGYLIVFPPNSDGDATPSSVLSGPSTELFQPWGYAVGPSTP
ncbi:MAG TPA: choice-of-anchor D domain-containing protein [Candidatus Binataceae bacterium]|nr:choice-of-anchor D domain-containing protein [Candidatus Binataceae bacterium]